MPAIFESEGAVAYRLGTFVNAVVVGRWFVENPDGIPWECDRSRTPGMDLGGLDCPLRIRRWG